MSAYGSGFSAYVPGGGLTGAGVIRAADVTVQSGQNRSGYHYYVVAKGPAGQITAPGDSGGPDILWQNGRPYIAGIHSGGSMRCAANLPANVPCNASNAIDLSNSFSNSISESVPWLADVLKTSWDATRAAQAFDLYGNELASMKWSVTDVNTASWSLARRAATSVCYARGFASGVLSGHQILPKIGVVCVGGAASWADVTQAQIDATPWRFTGVETTGWAAAGRAADALCAQRPGGYATGYFNGHQSGGNYGLVCVRDVIKEDVFLATDVNTATWADAARRATNHCVDRGHAGGFPVGHQLAQKQMVACFTQGTLSIASATPDPVVAGREQVNVTGSFPGANTLTAEVRCNGALVSSPRIERSSATSVTVSFPARLTTSQCTIGLARSDGQTAQSAAFPVNAAGFIKWRSLGDARDVGCGQNECWKVTDQPAPSGGFRLARSTEDAFTSIPGAGVQIDVGPLGAWLVNDNGGIFQWNGSDWTNVPGGATDIGVGANGAVWVLGTTRAPDGGYEAWRYTDGSAWQRMPGAGVALDVGPDGLPWLVNEYGQIFRFDGTSWSEVGGRARDIAIGADGTVFVVGTNPLPEGFAVHRWAGSGWEEYPSQGAARISVKGDGTPVITTSSNVLKTPQ